MVIEQTVDIPASRHLSLDLPKNVPSGRVRVVLSFDTPDEAAESVSVRERWIPLVSWLQKRREERFRQAVMQVAGKYAHVFNEDGVTLQRRWRDEWDTGNV
jgi:hypothetical protein